MGDLERENVRLKRLVADLSLKKPLLKDVLGKLVSPERAVRPLNASGGSMVSRNVMPAGLSVSRAERAIHTIVRADEML